MVLPRPVEFAPPMDPREDEKRAAAQAAALLVEDGMRLGLGTGTTVAHFLPALARRFPSVGQTFNLEFSCAQPEPSSAPSLYAAPNARLRSCILRRGWRKCRPAAFKALC